MSGFAKIITRTDVQQSREFGLLIDIFDPESWQKSSRSADILDPSFGI
jgi:hypothetical protein